MPEYLSPGVYVEEFESGSRPMSGVSTSTVGFLGAAEKGEIEGLPELVTSFAEFRRKFGGYLPEKDYQDCRYLAYAVEQFFSNGGGRCYVMRVGDKDSLASSSVEINKKWKIEANSKGTWGDRISVRVFPSGKSIEVLKLPEAIKDSKDVICKVDSVSGINKEDILRFEIDNSIFYASVNKIDAKNNTFTFESNDDITKILTPATSGDKPTENKDIKISCAKCELTVRVVFKDEIETEEIFENVSLEKDDDNHIEKLFGSSKFIRITEQQKSDPAKPQQEDPAKPQQEPAKPQPAKPQPEDPSKPQSQSSSPKPPFELFTGLVENDFSPKNPAIFKLTGGQNGKFDKGLADPSIFTGVDGGPGKRTGIQAFIDNEEISLIAAPGITDITVQQALITHCQNLKSRFAVLDIKREAVKDTELLAHRNNFDSDYAAMYHPWLNVYDPLEKRVVSMPPSGAVLGIYARVDTSRGVHKAPANEVINNCLGLYCQYNKGEQDILNPKGVNLIRYFTGEGIRVWGARTCSSNSLWKYVNVRRLFIYLEESIKRNTNWIVFEPNDQSLWARVQRTIENFLTTVWRSGALMGSTTAEAFFVKVDRSTMSQDDIDNGRLICVIGVAPVKPAEFVIFRITQKAGEQQ